MAEKALIELKNICKSYNMAGRSHQVLHDVCFKIYQGDMLAIVGASGSGKSTLMNIIGLLDKADSGLYYLKNQPITELSDDEQADLRNSTIGFVFQQFNLLPRFSAERNVALPLTYRQMSRQLIDEKVAAALDKVGMGAYLSHKPAQLSGGQQQRVAIARALVTEPEVILADEPTGALDSKTGEGVMQLFHRLNDEGRTIIMITHDQNIASQCQRRISLADGYVVEDNHALA